MNDAQIARTGATVFCRIFFDFIPSFIEEIKHGIDYSKSIKEGQQYRSEQGKEFKSEKNLVLDAKQRNKSKTAEIKSTVVKSGRKDLKSIVNACKKRGVDIYIREKPKNFDTLVERYNANDNLSLREQEMLQAFCDFDKEGNITNIHGDGGVIMFKAQDLQQVEEAIKDVDQKTLNIQRRKQRAKERFNKNYKQRDAKSHNERDR